MATSATTTAPQTAIPAKACTQPPSSRLRTPTEMSTAAIPAAIPAALPHASAPCAPCGIRVAAATRAIETTTATITSIDDGGGSWIPLAGCAARRKTASPPVVRAAPISSTRRGACLVRIARTPRATTSATASIGCTTATGATARAATWDPVPSMVADCPSIQRRRLTRRRRLRPPGVRLSSAASCCRTAPTANSTAASIASSRPAAGLPEAASGCACIRTGLPRKTLPSA